MVKYHQASDFNKKGREKMEYKEVLENVRKIQGLSCKGCAECNGLACGNTMPGPGSKAPGNGANDNWKAWRNVKVNMDCGRPPV